MTRRPEKPGSATLRASFVHVHEDPLLVGWHEAKSQACFDERAFDFGYAIKIFDGPMFEKIDDRADDGELRVQARGLIDGKPYYVVFSAGMTQSGSSRFSVFTGASGDASIDDRALGASKLIVERFSGHDNREENSREARAGARLDSERAGLIDRQLQP